MLISFYSETRQINAELGQCKAENFRIEDVRKAVVNGKLVKLFNAYQKIDKAFVFAGQFSAPVKMANKDLWKLLSQ